MRSSIFNSKLKHIHLKAVRKPENDVYTQQTSNSPSSWRTYGFGLICFSERFTGTFEHGISFSYAINVRLRSIAQKIPVIFYFPVFGRCVRSNSFSFTFTFFICFFMTVKIETNQAVLLSGPGKMDLVCRKSQVVITILISSSVIRTKS